LKNSKLLVQLLNLNSRKSKQKNQLRVKKKHNRDGYVFYFSFIVKHSG